MQVFADATVRDYPRVTFLATLTARNASSQLALIERDLRSNLTAQFSPTAIAVSFTVLSTGGRKLLSASINTDELPQLPAYQSQRTVPRKDDAISTLLGTDRGQSGGTKEQELARGCDYTCSPVRMYLSSCAEHHITSSTLQARRLASDTLERNGSLEEITQGTSGGRSTRQLLQAGNLYLQVNVTFPSTSQSSTSQATANSFSQALQSNPASVLGGFERGYGSVGVSSVAQTLVTASESGFSVTAPPPASPSLDSTNGSVGAFVGIAVAAILVLTVFAGRCQTQSQPSLLLTNHFCSNQGFI